MQLDSGCNVSCVLILILHTLFHTGQMDQVKHLVPVDGVLGRIGSILNRLFHQLQLFDPVTHQLQLHIQGIPHKMIVRIIDRHIPDIIQRKSQKLQQQDLLQSRQILIRVKPCTCVTYIGRF